MIRSFKHRGLKRLYERGDRSGIPPDLVDTAQEILSVLDRAGSPQALHLPGYRLHPLKGDLKGFWSVTVRETKEKTRHAHEKPRSSRTHRPERVP
jgi:proteic killer suppression protein